MSVDEIIKLGESPERIFPILNKYDRIWSYYGNKPFCEVFKLVTEGKDLTDIEFTQLMEEHINKNNIK
jgi:hypothetical protein